MTLSGYDNWLLRGSGAFSTDAEVTLDVPCPNCGTTEGYLVVNDFGIASLECLTDECRTDLDVDTHYAAAGEPDEPDFEPDDDIRDWWE